MSETVLYGSNSAVSNSLVYISHRYNFNKYANLNNTATYILKNAKANNDNTIKAGAIGDFCLMRYNQNIHNPFIDDKDELTQIIDYLCTE